MKDFNDNVKEVKQKASNLYESAKEHAVDAYHKTKPETEELASQLNATASDLYTCGKEALGQVEGEIKQSIACMAKAIRTQPLSSVLLAAGIGYLWAKLTK